MLPSISASFAEKHCFPVKMTALLGTEWRCFDVYASSSLPCELGPEPRAERKLLDAKRSRRSLRVFKCFKTKNASRACDQMVAVWFTCVRWRLRSYETRLGLTVNCRCWPLLLAVIGRIGIGWYYRYTLCEQGQAPLRAKRSRRV